MKKLTVRDILKKINSAHHIRVQSEHKYEFSEGEYTIATVCVDIHTSMYGNPTTPVDEDILSGEIRALFPIDSILYLYLEPEEEEE